VSYILPAQVTWPIRQKLPAQLRHASSVDVATALNGQNDSRENDLGYVRHYKPHICADGTVRLKMWITWEPWAVKIPPRDISRRVDAYI
jgi:hypothetical protein